HRALSEHKTLSISWSHYPILHEQGFNSAWIEMQLAHVDKNSIRGTYNHALYLDGRREMMQWYADYIDSLSSRES
ncbi:tyrosine-type recombinase/integrase, partial [Shigella sonnei]